MMRLKEIEKRKVVPISQCTLSLFLPYQALLIEPSEVQLQNSFVLQVGCTDISLSLQYLNISDNDNTISKISIISSLLWLL